MSLITYGDADISSHTHGGGFAIGGDLNDLVPAQSKVIGGEMSWVRGSINCPLCQWRGQLVRDELPYEWEQFEHLATHVLPSAQVTVINQGASEIEVDASVATRAGTYVHQQHLVVFRGSGTVTVYSTAYGRQFHPSILAPFAMVRAHDGVGYIDGVVIARSYVAIGGKKGRALGKRTRGGVQLHGVQYTGPLTCAASPAAALPEVVYDAPDIWSRRKCLKKRYKGKCNKKLRVRTKCALTCATQ
jgi:hypothetical protein